MHERISAAIKDIAADNRAGAAEMLRRAARVFSLLDATPSESILDVEQTRALIIEACAGVAKAQPLMTPLANLASLVISAAINSTSAHEMINSAIHAAHDFTDKAERAASVTARRAGELIFDGATVLTHSRSSTVLAAFVNARRAAKTFSVIATESRPIMEGRALARSLADEGLAVTLIADMAAALVMERVDMVMVGADQVTPIHLVNKIGTLMIALAARERGLPVYALCDTSKFTAHTGNLIEEEHSANELWPAVPEQITVSNRYFEPTPLAYLSSIITEDGALDPEEAARRASSARMHPALLDALKINDDGA
jgi:translation initiation factor 2B subunit (eIF-2B alpha/beta/delta family)